MDLFALAKEVESIGTTFEHVFNALIRRSRRVAKQHADEERAAALKCVPDIGWIIVRSKYDDVVSQAGNSDRPALKRLLGCSSN